MLATRSRSANVLATGCAVFALDCSGRAPSPAGRVPCWPGFSGWRRTIAALLVGTRPWAITPRATGPPEVPYSTVTDLARLRGWSTSWPLAAASSQAKTWSGTVATSGWSRVGTAGMRISMSA